MNIIRKDIHKILVIFQCMYSLHIDKKNKKHKVCLTNFRILLILSHVSQIHNAYNLYVIKNNVTIVPRGNFAKKKIIFNL